MKPSTSTFRRGTEQLVLQQQQTDQGFALLIVVAGQISNIPFQDLAALDVFQRDMEEMLIHTGWTLHRFAPERRRRDRRRFPREDNDRRRWWTDPVDDGAEEPSLLNKGKR